MTQIYQHLEEKSGYLSEYMIPLGEKVMAYNGFEHDVRYLKIAPIKRSISQSERQNISSLNIYSIYKFDDML